MKIKYTARGFRRADFTDGNGVECSIQESSAAENDFIWLGCNDPPENVQCTTRMHLTRGQVAELLPLLQAFVESGKLEAQE